MSSNPAVGAIAAGASALLLLGVAPADAGQVTTVRLKVSGCEGCKFIAHDGRTWKKAWRKVATSTQVVDGRSVIKIPRKLTRTTSLEVVHPEGFIEMNARPFVAFTWEKQDGMWVGGICWGKQKGARARLRIVVTEYKARPVPGAARETFIRSRLAKLPRAASAGVNGSPGCPELAD
jgi:hypothetical protein